MSDPMGRGHDNGRYGGKPSLVGHRGHPGHPVHHKRARGGSVKDPKGEGHRDWGHDKEEKIDKGIGAEPKEKAEVYEGAGSRTIKEAERKKGGRRADGGKVSAKPKVPALAVGGSPSRHMRMDRRGRKAGGSVGADSRPLTIANHLSEGEGEKLHYKSTDEEDD